MYFCLCSVETDVHFGAVGTLSTGADLCCLCQGRTRRNCETAGRGIASGEEKKGVKNQNYDDVNNTSAHSKNSTLYDSLILLDFFEHTLKTIIPTQGATEGGPISRLFKCLSVT